MHGYHALVSIDGKTTTVGHRFQSYSYTKCHTDCGSTSCQPLTTATPPHPSHPPKKHHQIIRRGIRTKYKSACLHWTARRAASAQVDKMITLNVNQGFGWGPSCNLTVVYRVWGGRGGARWREAAGMEGAVTGVSGVLGPELAAKLTMSPHQNVIANQPWT